MSDGDPTSSFALPTGGAGWAPDRPIELYDTTLRDGLGMEGLSLSLENKLALVLRLDALGMHYIEGGYPGSNPKDAEFFQRARALELKHARLVAFGSTRRPGGDAATDPAIRAVLDAETPVITLVGKSSAEQTRTVLQTTEEENLAMIRDSVATLRARGRDVIFDAEHFFDGFASDRAYALETLRAAAAAGASAVVLCDTNGGSLPALIVEGVRAARAVVDCRVGIHVHNDVEMAVANTILAVLAGATQVQACVNGWGERTGNANMFTVIANLKLKLGLDVVTDAQLKQITETSHFASELANLQPNAQQPYVGSAAFAHKAGLHAAAVARAPGSYTHVEPAAVGNQERVLVSELSGRGSILGKLREQGVAIELSDDDVRRVLQQVKEHEAAGFQYESAEASFEMLVRRQLPDYRSPFDVEDFLIVQRRRHTRRRNVGDAENELMSQAMVKLRVNDQVSQVAADGNGPVSALNSAVHSALGVAFPGIEKVHLIDYKVRIIDSAAGADAAVRVLIESSDGLHLWRTVGASTDVIEASWIALQDAYDYWIMRWGRTASR
jgi:2-isopropylmalate synthase